MWRHFLICNSIDIKKISYAKRCSGVVVAHVLWLMVGFQGKNLFLVLWKVWTHTAYEFIYDEFSMNSCIFCTLNIWIHTNMNSYYVWIHTLFAVIMYEFIYFCSMNSYYVWIHILFAVIMYEFLFFAVQNKSCKCARDASVQRKPRGQSLSSPPAPTRPRPAAPTVRVACGSPDS